MALRYHFAVINHLVNAMFRVSWLYTLEWVEINFHRLRHRFQIVAVTARPHVSGFVPFSKVCGYITVCVFAGYVWTLSVTATKRLRIQTNPDTCGRGLRGGGGEGACFPERFWNLQPRKWHFLWFWGWKDITRQCFSTPVRGVFCLGEIQKMPSPMGFAVFLFTLPLSFGIGNENHISVLNIITKYDMVVASALDM